MTLSQQTNPQAPSSTSPPSYPISTALFFALLLLCLIPIWLFPYFPSQDGPSHIYNASIFRHLWQPHYAIFREFYSVNPLWSSPNWVGHLILVGLMLLVPSLIAEKILLTGYLLLFPLALRYALGSYSRQAQTLALFGLPLLYNWFFHMGFYNFCYSLALFLFVLGYFLRHHHHWTLPRLLAFTLLIILLYYCHLSALLMAIGVIGMHLLWNAYLQPAGLPSKIKSFLRQLLPVTLAFLPAVIMAVLFLLRPSIEQNISPAMSLLIRLRYFLIFLVSFQKSEALLSAAFALLTILTLLYTLRHRPKWSTPEALLLSILPLLLLTLIVPPNLSRGGFIIHRLVLFIYLLAVLYIGATQTTPRIRLILQTAATLLTLAMLALATRNYQHLNTYLTEYASVSPHIPDNSTLMPIFWELNQKDDQGKILSLTTDPFEHAIDYVALDRPLIDLGNYEPEVGYFPLLFNQNIPTRHAPGWALNFHPAQGRGSIDYILLWTSGDTAPPDPRAKKLMAELNAHNYMLEYTSTPRGFAQLFRWHGLPPGQ